MIKSVKPSMKQLFEYEEMLLMNDHRNNPDFIKKVISEDCVEIDESGMSNYKKGMKLEPIKGVLYITDNSFESKFLSDENLLITYEAVQVRKNIRIKANCSSIWRNENNAWKVIFHQRTILNV